MREPDIVRWGVWTCGPPGGRGASAGAATHVFRIVLGTLAAILLSAATFRVLAADQSGAQAAPQDDSKEKMLSELPPGRARALVWDRCTQCHGPQVIQERRLDAAGWRKSLDYMASLGVELSDAEKRVIVDYLSEVLGPDSPPLTFVNLAEPMDLERLPGVDKKVAGAMVAYRGAHGPFRTKHDLLKVSGLSRSLYEKVAAYLSLDEAAPPKQPAASKERQ